MSAPSARAVAHDILVRVEGTDAFADVLLGEQLAGTALGPEDGRLCTQLVYGTLAWQGRLDHHLGRLLRRPIEHLDSGVRAALRLGLYQLLFLDRVPAYAAIDTSVSLLRSQHAGMRGLVNAVLRKAAAGPHTLALPPAADRIRRLAVEWSHPVWIVERWAAAFDDDDLVALLCADNQAPPTAVRVNPNRATVEAVMAELSGDVPEVRAGRWASSAVVVERGGVSAAARAHAEGRVSFQSEASQLVVDLLAPDAGMRILDACAAPGAKTTAIAERLAARGAVIALDPRRSALGRLGIEAGRLGLSGVHAVTGDARLPPLRTPFDAVLVDAPCTGLGTLRRHPELRWRRRPEDVLRLAALQRAILHQVAPLVRPGGILVYAVCTLTREESEDVITDFLAAHPRFGVEPGQRIVSERARELFDSDGCMRTLPSRHGVDGFFAVRLRSS